MAINPGSLADALMAIGKQSRNPCESIVQVSRIDTKFALTNATSVGMNSAANSLASTLTLRGYLQLA